MRKLFCPPCLIGLILVLAVLGGYFLLKGGYRTPASTTPEVTPKTTAPKEASEEVTAVKEVTVSGTEFSFSPAVITVKNGERVKVAFQNKGNTGHNFGVLGLGVSTKTIGPGQTDTIEFTAPASGTYTFICSVPGHREAGMEGSLQVE